MNIISKIQVKNNQNDYISKRCINQSNNEKATVIDKFNIKNAEFYGLIYDNEVGKYDGEYENIRYFTCKPRHGAFVKAKKLTFGQQLHQVIYKKYVTDRTLSQMYLSDGQIDKPMQFVGQDQIDKLQHQIQSITIFNLEKENVESIDLNVQKIMTPNCECLVLRDCLLYNIDAFYDAIMSLPNLNDLDLSENYNITLSDLTDKQIITLNNQNHTNCHLSVNLTQQSAQDFNILQRLPFINSISWCGNQKLKINEINENKNLQNIKLSGSLIQIDNIYDLLNLLYKFQNIQQIESMDLLNETYNINNFDKWNDSIQKQYYNSISTLLELNLQQSSLNFESLLLIHKYLPNLQNIKYLKIFNGSFTGIKSILQSDQAMQLVIAILGDKLQVVNSYKIKSSDRRDSIYFLQSYVQKFVMCQYDNEINNIFMKEELLPILKEIMIKNDCQITQQLQQLFEYYNISTDGLQLSQIQQQQKTQLYDDTIITFELDGQQYKFVRSIPLWKWRIQMKKLTGKNMDNALLYTQDGRIIKLDRLSYTELFTVFSDTQFQIRFQ